MVFSTCFLSVSITPDFALGYFKGGFGSASNDQGGIVIAGLIIVGAIVLTIASIVRSKHKKDPIKHPEEQKEDIKMSYEMHPDNQLFTKISVKQITIINVLPHQVI